MRAAPCLVGGSRCRRPVRTLYTFPLLQTSSSPSFPPSPLSSSPFPTPYQLALWICAQLLEKKENFVFFFSKSGRNLLGFFACSEAGVFSEKVIVRMQMSSSLWLGLRSLSRLQHLQGASHKLHCFPSLLSALLSFVFFLLLLRRLYLQLFILFSYFYFCVLFCVLPSGFHFLSPIIVICFPNLLISFSSFLLIPNSC